MWIWWRVLKGMKTLQVRKRSNHAAVAAGLQLPRSCALGWQRVCASTLKEWRVLAVSIFCSQNLVFIAQGALQSLDLFYDFTADFVLWVLCNFVPLWCCAWFGGISAEWFGQAYNRWAQLMQKSGKAMPDVTVEYMKSIWCKCLRQGFS